MDSIDLKRYQSTLEQAGVIFGPGLSLVEVHQIQTHYRFRFPPDYCDFLMNALPLSNGFVDWRNADEANILEMLAWPFEGMCFDIERNRFWLKAWGQRPSELENAFSIAKTAVDQAPVLIPILGHRYIPSNPEESGNPVFSVSQTDIIYYGRDLREYLENEFRYAFYGKNRYQITDPVKPIAFWSYLVDINNGVIDDGRV